MKLNDAERHSLKSIARQSILHGLQFGSPPPLDLTQLPEALTQQAATFVTLEKQGQLRGCIGTLEAVRPLAEDVVTNSFSAAFRDPRFPPVNTEEMEDIDIHLSILNPAQPMDIQSEADLIAQLRPGVDGLILDDGMHRATFLPSVWQSLPEPSDFVQQLKRKAGLSPEDWPVEMRAYRYTTDSF